MTSSVIGDIKKGIHAIRKHAWLIALLYAIGLVITLLVTLPLFHAWASQLEASGFGDELSREFDLILLVEIFRSSAGLLAPFVLHLLWVIPLYLIWKIAAAAGLIEALYTEENRAFWRGISRYTGRVLVLALFYLPILLVVVIAAVLPAILVNVLFPGEVGTFWAYAFILPLLLASGLILIDLMQDYSRILLVVGHEKVVDAWSGGITWPFRHPASVVLYLGWFTVGLVLILVPFLLDSAFDAASFTAIWSLFFLQQVALFARTAVTAGWIKSEIALYRRVGGPERVSIEPGEISAFNTAMETDLANVPFADHEGPQSENQQP